MDDSRSQRIGDDGIAAVPSRTDAAQSLRTHAADILQGFWAFAPDALLAADATGRIALVNSRTETLFGYARGELIGLPVEALIPDRFRGAHVMMREGFVRDGKQRAMETGLELWGRRKDGSEFPLEISLSHFRSEGAPIVLAAIRDITEKHRRDQEILAAREAAEAASAAKSQFLATMSHEIRTPMNSVIGLVHLLQSTPLEPKQLDYLRKVEQAANSLLSIINDILDFSKADAGRLAVDSVPFDLEQVVETVSNLSSARAHRKDLEFSVHVAPDVPLALLGDPLRLTQILSNLCTNAVKFTEYGEVLLSVTREERSADSVTLHFRVRDTGIGIESAQIESIFEPFRQADSSTTRKYGGTGLGLAICKRLADLMGGRIWAESEPGKGSTFHLTLCFTTQVSGQPASRGLAMPDLNGLEVLLADDSATTRGILAETLEDFGFRVTAVDSGDAAIRTFRHPPGKAFGLVVLDREMPGRDGVDAAAIIAAEAGAAAPPVIMLTTFGYQDLTSRAEELGIRNFLPKPVTRSTLFDAVIGIFANRSEAAGPMETIPDTPAPAPVKDDLSRIRGSRILLVEDNEVNQLVTEEMLQQKGFEVDIAGNGVEALERMRALTDPPHYDLVFLDLQMPRMDGYDCARAIRKLAGCERLPLVALTAEAMQGTRERCLEAGMNDYIAKPLRPTEIFACLLRWIKPPASAEDLAALGLLERLAELLARDDLAAVGCVKELQGSPGLANDRELARIADLTRSYQFEEALGVLATLRARLSP